MTDSNTTEVALDTDPTPKPRARTVAVVVGLVAALGAAVFAGLSLADDGNNPEDPVRAMFEAVEQGDVLGVLEQLEPGERDALRDPLTDLVDELDRLDILDDADLRDLQGIEISVDDLELVSEQVGSDTSGSRARVFVRELEFSATDGQGTISYEDGCATIDVPGAPTEETCAGDDPTAALDGLLGGGDARGDVQ